MIETKYNGHKPSYYKVWDVKQKGIAKMFGNWEDSYQRLQKLLMAYIDQDLTTQVLYCITPTDEDNTVLLHYVFWSFYPCIDGFKYCKPVISIDGTHLYGKYRWQCQPTLTIRYSLLPLLLWILSQGLVGDGFYNDSVMRLAT